VAGRAAEFRFEHRIASRSEKLRLFAESPAMTASEWSAMDDHDERRRLFAFSACRQGQIGRYLEPVAR
jgi:hypothetical protein